MDESAVKDEEDEDKEDKASLGTDAVGVVVEQQIHLMCANGPIIGTCVPPADTTSPTGIPVQPTQLHATTLDTKKEST